MVIPGCGIASDEDDGTFSGLIVWTVKEDAESEPFEEAEKDNYFRISCFLGRPLPLAMAGSRPSEKT